MTYTKLPCHETPSGRFECVLSEREVTGVTVTAGASAAVGTRCLHHSRADARAPGPARDCCPPCGGLGRQGLGEGQRGCSLWLRSRRSSKVVSSCLFPSVLSLPWFPSGIGGSATVPLRPVSPSAVWSSLFTHRSSPPTCELRTPLVVHAMEINSLVQYL